jgi:hypothetical protein
MIMDKRTEFADAVSVAVGASTINVGDQIDLSVIQDIGNGQPVYLIITCDTGIITGGAAGTIRFQLASDATASIAVDGSQSIHWTSQLFVTDDDALNDIDAGETIAVVALPLDGSEPYEQFLGVQAIVATTTITAGKINAFLSLDPKGWKAFPNAI